MGRLASATGFSRPKALLRDRWILIPPSPLLRRIFREHILRISQVPRAPSSQCRTPHTVQSQIPKCSVMHNWEAQLQGAVGVQSSSATPMKSLVIAACSYCAIIAHLVVPVLLQRCSSTRLYHYPHPLMQAVLLSIASPVLAYCVVYCVVPLGGQHPHHPDRICVLQRHEDFLADSPEAEAVDVFSAISATAGAVLEVDPALRHLRFRLVPKIISEVP